MIEERPRSMQNFKVYFDKIIKLFPQLTYCIRLSHLARAGHHLDEPARLRQAAGEHLGLGSSIGHNKLLNTVSNFAHDLMRRQAGQTYLRKPAGDGIVSRDGLWERMASRPGVSLRDSEQ